MPSIGSKSENEQSLGCVRVINSGLQKRHKLGEKGGTREGQIGSQSARKAANRRGRVFEPHSLAIGRALHNRAKRAARSGCSDVRYAY